MTAPATKPKNANVKRASAVKRRSAKGGAASAQPPASHRTAVVGGLAVALAAAFHVWTGLLVSQLGYQRSKAIELNQRLETQREELADALASLLRTEYLEVESEARLGLGSPSAGQVVDLRAKQLASTHPRVMP